MNASPGQGGNGASAPHSFRRAPGPALTQNEQTSFLQCWGSADSVSKSVKLQATVSQGLPDSSGPCTKGPRRCPRRAGGPGAAGSRRWGSVPPAAASCRHNQTRGGQYEPVHWAECGWAPSTLPVQQPALEGQRALGGLSRRTSARKAGALCYLPCHWAVPTGSLWGQDLQSSVPEQQT